MINKNETIALYEKYNSLSKVASDLGVHLTTVRRRLNKWGVDTSDRRTYRVNDDFFETINTEDKAYWLGFISTDGNVNYTRNQLSIALAIKDIKHLEKLLIALSSNYKIYVTPVSAHIGITSKKIVSDLGNYGVVPRKTHIITPYSEIDPFLERHYWRSAIDGDGSLGIRKNGKYLNKYIKLYGNKAMCEGFKAFCEKHVEVNSNVGLTRKVHQFEIKGKNSIPIIEILYKDSNVYLDRKYKRAMEVLK